MVKKEIKAIIVSEFENVGGENILTFYPEGIIKSEVIESDSYDPIISKGIYKVTEIKELQGLFDEVKQAIKNNPKGVRKKPDYENEDIYSTTVIELVNGRIAFDGDILKIRNKIPKNKKFSELKEGEEYTPEGKIVINNIFWSPKTSAMEKIKTIL